MTYRIQRWMIILILFVLVVLSGFVFFCGNEETQRNHVESQDELGLVTFSEKKYRYNSDITSILFLGIDNESKML